MRFQVPQFIEVESKIFGPLTLKQFIYLVGGAGLIFIIYTYGGIFFAILLGAPIGIFAFLLTFYKVNNQPFVKIVENAVRYISGPRLYLWRKKEPEKQKEFEEIKKQKEGAEVYIPKLTQSRLKDLAWSLDIREEIKNNK